MTGGKSWEEALKENREVHITAMARSHLNDVNKLQRMQIEEQTRRRLKAELGRICLSFSALSPEELAEYRAEMARKVKCRSAYFGGSFKSRADIA